MLCWVSRTGIRSALKYVLRSGTVLIGVPSKRVAPSMFWMLSHPSVTVGRLTIDCVSRGKFASSAARSSASDTPSVFSRNANRAGNSADTEDSGIACRSAVVCGKFFCSAATTSACESPVCCETNAISFGTSAAPVPDVVPIGSAMSTFLEMMSMPARAPATRSAANAGLAASRTFWPSLRRGISSGRGRRSRPGRRRRARRPTAGLRTGSRSLPCITNLLTRSLRVDGSRHSGVRGSDLRSLRP